MLDTGQGQEQWVNIALSQLQKLCLHNSSYVFPFGSTTVGWKQSEDALQTFILWMFQDHLMKCQNQTECLLLPPFAGLIQDTNAAFFPDSVVRIVAQILD